MTILRINKFSGEVPRITPRLLPDTMAQQAYNVRLTDGALTPIRMPRYAHRLPTSTEPWRSIYRVDENTWMAWHSPDVSVAQAPVAQNRLYFTGDGPPKMYVNGTIVPLALYPPEVAPTVAINGTGTGDVITIVWVYTWVTEYDEESAPSPLSNATEWQNGQIATLSGFSSPQAGRGVNRMRLYRSVTGTSGSTGLYYVKERAVSTASWEDAVTDIDTNEALTSTNFNPPPDDMQGIIALPNGMMVAFSGRDILFSEPYIPHAWPEKYRLTVDFDIVGLGAFASSVAIMTKGNPYVVSGTAPESMQMERLELNLPCINFNSIVDLGYSIAYASHDGLVTISSNGAAVVSKNLFTREQWQRINPETMTAAQSSGRYMASYSYLSDDNSLLRGIMLIDLTGDIPFLIRSRNEADTMFYEIETGALYFLRNGYDIYEWDAVSEPPEDLQWRSKQFRYATPLNFGCILIEGFDSVVDRAQQQQNELNEDLIRERNRVLMAEMAAKGEIASSALASITFAGSLIRETSSFESYLEINVWANGKVVATINQADKTFRLPAGFLADWWEIEVKTNMVLTSISLASQPSEMGQG